MKIKTDEITSVIKQEIEQFSSELEISEVGQVVEVGDGIPKRGPLAVDLAGKHIVAHDVRVIAVLILNRGAQVGDGVARRLAIEISSRQVDEHDGTSIDVKVFRTAKVIVSQVAKIGD